MGEIYATVIGIEQYRDPFASRLKYGEDDARAVFEALLALGCPKENAQLILGSEATKTTIEGTVKESLELLDVDDQYFFFFAGHGWSDGQMNYLLAHDSRTNDLYGTAVRLQFLLGLAQSSECERIIVFLDACHSGVEGDPMSRVAYASLDLELDDEQYCVGFASCGANEKSHSSELKKHGIWTFHLLEALRGEVPELLDTRNRLRTNDLQKFLRKQVGKTAKSDFRPAKTQRPRRFGHAESDPVIADLSSLIAQIEGEKEANRIGLADAIIRSERRQSFDQFEGFSRKKKHTVPTAVSSSATSWLWRLAEPMLTKRREELFQALRKRMKIASDDIGHEVGEGVLEVRTPRFRYQCSAFQDPDEPGDVVIEEAIVEFFDPSVVDDNGFNTVFPNTFDTVRMVLADPVDVRQIIRKLEKRELDVDMDAQREWCSVRLDGCLVRVDVASVDFRFDANLEPRALIAGYRDAFSTLLATGIKGELATPKRISR